MGGSEGEESGIEKGGGEVGNRWSEWEEGSTRGGGGRGEEKS